MIWSLIFAIVIVWWFKALWSASIAKIKIVEETKIEKDAIYFSEKLFSIIKQWWTIDYEEYFNRKVVWPTEYQSGHYLKLTWFWNFWPWWNLNNNNYWDSFYYCLSWNGNNMWTDWCVESFNSTWWIDLTGEYQRYGQYSLQFIDYNANEDNDGWNEDEDAEWNFRWDDDDEYLWLGPNVFTWWTNRSELYLISWDWKTRTYFRWKVKNDPDSLTPDCDYNNPKTPTWTWCLWTIQFLKLQGKDYWLDHIAWTNDEWEYDWVVDTWLYHKDFDNSESIAWNWSNDKWIDIFPSTINITDFQVFPYPNKNINYAWKDYSPEVNISPYIRIKFNILPSLKKRSNIKWETPIVKIATTINLTDEFTK